MSSPRPNTPPSHHSKSSSEFSSPPGSRGTSATSPSRVSGAPSSTSSGTKQRSPAKDRSLLDKGNTQLTSDSRFSKPLEAAGSSGKSPSSRNSTPTKPTINSPGVPNPTTHGLRSSPGKPSNDGSPGSVNERPTTTRRPQPASPIDGKSHSSAYKKSRNDDPGTGSSKAPERVRGNGKANEPSPAPHGILGSLSKLHTSDLAISNISLKQQMVASDLIVIYRPDEPLTGSARSVVSQNFSKANFKISPKAVITDNDGAALIFHSHKDNEGNTELINMQKETTFTWLDILHFLHSSKLPEDQDKKKGMFRFLWILINQKGPERRPDIAKAKSLPVLEIESGPRRLGETSLAKTMESFLSTGAHDLRSLEQHIKGLRVEVFQSRGKTSVITGLARQDDSHGRQQPLAAKVNKYGGGSKDVEFYQKSTGNYIKVFDHFRENRQHIDNHPGLPVVNVGTRTKSTYVPASCCTISDIPKHDALVVSVGDMMQMISNGFMNHKNAPKWLSNTVDNNCIRFPGLKLPLTLNNSPSCQVAMTADTINYCRIKTAPSLGYANAKQFSPTTGTWSVTQTGMISNSSPTDLRCKVAVLTIGRSRLMGKQDFDTTLTALHSWLGSFGMGLSNGTSVPDCAMPKGKLTSKMEEDIKSNITTLMAEDKVVKAVVVLLSSKSKPLYNYVKHLCDKVLGVHSVCIDTHRLAAAPNDKGYWFQTSLKLNAKTGGRNQSLASSRSESLDLKHTMIVGIDMMGPSSMTTGVTKPIVLMISCTGHDLSQWPATVRIQDTESLKQTVSALVNDRIKQWKKKSASPSLANVIIYYKGLSEASYDDELVGLPGEMKGIKLTLLAANKDHHAKLQILSPGEKDRIPVGSMITRTRDGDETWEFLIQGHQPQHVNDGTTAPSTLEASLATLPVRYTVLYNDAFTGPKAKTDVENLTHDMQYLFASSTAAISDTLPIHYVGLLRKRVELLLHARFTRHGGRSGNGNQTNPAEDVSLDVIQVHEKIKDEMFYL
ncbi:MAG: hypothetical protein Q9169_005727 [Polycauliona sp. 2 TL-2023]